MAAPKSPSAAEPSAPGRSGRRPRTRSRGRCRGSVALRTRTASPERGFRSGVPMGTSSTCEQDSSASSRTWRAMGLLVGATQDRGGLGHDRDHVAVAHLAADRGGADRAAEHSRLRDQLPQLVQAAAEHRFRLGFTIAPRLVDNRNAVDGRSADRRTEAAELTAGPDPPCAADDPQQSTPCSCRSTTSYPRPAPCHTCATEWPLSSAPVTRP